MSEDVYIDKELLAYNFWLESTSCLQSHWQLVWYLLVSSRAPVLRTAAGPERADSSVLQELGGEERSLDCLKRRRSWRGDGEMEGRRMKEDE